MFTVDNIVVLDCDMLVPRNQDQFVSFAPEQKIRNPAR